MPAPRQTLPSITMRYVRDENTGSLVWALVLSDGKQSTEPVTIAPETAAGIAQIVDVALPLPVDLGGEQTSAERVVRTAHVQTLEAQLAAAQAGLKATTPDTASATAEPSTEQVPAKPASKPTRKRSTARSAKAKLAAAPPVADEPPVLETVNDDTPTSDAPPLPDEPPHFGDLPERLPRSSHLQVPPVDEF